MSGDDEIDSIVFVECLADTGHGPPWPESLVRSVRRMVRRRLARVEADDPPLSALH